jgi:hypothetical protein
LARPVATFLEYAFVAAMFQELSSCKSGFISQVWAREGWKVGMMGLKEAKMKLQGFKVPGSRLPAPIASGQAGFNGYLLYR